MAEELVGDDRIPKSAFKPGTRETNKKCTVRIFRYDPTKDEEPRYETYKVPYLTDMRILDVLNYVYERLNVDIAYSWNCGIKRCGLCAVLVNGTPKLACWEPAEMDMTIEPLPNFPIIRDLVIDRSSYDEQVLRMRAYFERTTPSEGHPENLTHEQMIDVHELMKCNECLQCTSVCPVVNVFWKEFSGPAAFVKLARWALDPRDKLDRTHIALSEGIYACSDCGKCKEVCPFDIATPKIVFRKIRSMLVAEGKGPLEGQKQLEQKAIQTNWIIEPKGKSLLETAPRLSMPDVMKREEFHERVGFFVGCLINCKFQKVGNALIEILNKNNIEVYTPSDQVCCGYPLLATGEIEEVRKNFVEKNVYAFEGAGVSTVLAACPGCAKTLRNDYPQLLGRKPKFEMLHIAEYLANMKLDANRMKPVNLRITWADPCHLYRDLGIYDEPRSIIRKIPGVDFREMENSDLCCGAAGGLRAGIWGLSSTMANKKVEHIKKTGAEALVTSCPACRWQYRDHLRGKLQVLDLVELLTMAYE